ncbi:MAG TPA: YceI family protein [Bacteroidales bacterium]|nr:YceI family protein [Bacteroidales bacterium]
MTMKNMFFTLMLAAGILASCTSGGQKTESSDAKEVKEAGYDKAYAVDATQSTLEWQGYKPTGTHHGTVNITDGILTVENGNLTGGRFVIDLKSITVIDLTDAKDNAKLTGHLNSSDFFDTEKYPVATFVITDVNEFDNTMMNGKKEIGDIVPSHTITGNLTMKDTTRSITFNAHIALVDDMITAETNQFFLDRVRWNVQYGSKTLFNNLKDNFINDEMGIAIKLTARAEDYAMAGE